MNALVESTENNFVVMQPGSTVATALDPHNPSTMSLWVGPKTTNLHEAAGLATPDQERCNLITRNSLVLDLPWKQVLLTMLDLCFDPRIPKALGLNGGHAEAVQHAGREIANAKVDTDDTGEAAHIGTVTVSCQHMLAERRCLTAGQERRQEQAEELGH